MCVCAWKMPFVVCPECENEHEEETFEGFCEACGEEFEAAAAASGAGGRTGSGSESEDDGNISYKNIVVGVIVSAGRFPTSSSFPFLCCSKHHFLHSSLHTQQQPALKRHHAAHELPMCASLSSSR